jgi:hypothetical protein
LLTPFFASQKKDFFGKAFFLKERFIEVRGMFDDEEGKGILL